MNVTVADQIRTRLRVRLDLPSPGERRRLRKESGLSQQDIAEVVGVNRAAVSQWERGVRTPRGPLLDRYVEALRALKEAVR
ncbi:helix-turn-helix transcriptional regulator [Kitasatospora sp. NBC_01302]|uniref:helix-turn-helix transcriptional regulator n=1 Tax=Kitasatospora sp. NBC_01302 TaxID=2903575 RepID=UPI002E11A77C|nr:helix-turn-helix domain-containing protein [Kitasatospora sp. NBC_01302]